MSRIPNWILEAALAHKKWVLEEERKEVSRTEKEYEYRARVFPLPNKKTKELETCYLVAETMFNKAENAVRQLQRILDEQRG